MGESADLLDQKTHFAFGKNWESYARLVREEQVLEAAASLRRLAAGDLVGKRFLDIGCGSGLHSLAALRLGAREVVAVDIDPDSVATTRALLGARAAGETWSVHEATVFDLRSKLSGTFDAVYSWGVLHHTGALLSALRAASAMTGPHGQFIFALYRRTRLCWFWKREKRWYAKASPAAQGRARAMYIWLYRVIYALRQQGDFNSYIASYGQQRGMDFYHDVHDWLGGWPYESISPPATDRFLRELGMRQIRSFVQSHTSLGLRGSGCDEYVYERV
jgi:predicted RNA methylase